MKKLEKSSNANCAFVIRIPNDVYVLMLKFFVVLYPEVIQRKKI